MGARLGFVQDEDIASLLSKQYGVPSINLTQFETDSGVIKLVPEAFEASLESGGEESRRADLQFTTPGGRRIDLGMSAAPLSTPDGRAGFLFVFQDITETRRLQRKSVVQQRLAAVGEMAAGIAHEIRNPLASMSGSIQVLRQELPLKPEQAQLMDIVLRESERLNGTIKSFLAYARPQRISSKRFDLRRAVDDTALLLRHSPESAEAHRIEVDVPATPVWFEGDKGRCVKSSGTWPSTGFARCPTGAFSCSECGPSPVRPA